MEINTKKALNSYDLAAANSFKAQALLGLGKTEPAILLLKKSISIEPKYAFSHLYLGRIYEKQGKLQDALKEMKTALQYGQGFKKFFAVPDEITALEKKMQKSKIK